MGDLQILVSAVEAAVHAAIYDSSKSQRCQAAALIDASSDFNCVNCEAALHSIQHLCPLGSHQQMTAELMTGCEGRALPEWW